MDLNPRRLVDSLSNNEETLYKGDKYPYGVCDCDSGVAGGCCLGTGPAARTAIREGKEVRLCTRCNLLKDKSTEKLLVTKEHLQTFLDYDYIGSLAIQFELEE